MIRNICLLGVTILSINACADYQNIGQATGDDRLEQLSKTLSQGSYTHSSDMDLPNVSNVQVKLREKTIELNEETIEKKYGSSFHAIARRYVNSNAINVRDKPNGTVIGQLKRGQSLFIYDVAGEWERISKEGELQKWVDSNLLCSSVNCYKSSNNTVSQKVVNKSISSNTYVTPRKQVTAIGGCSCGSGNYCYGPRGGRFCYTSGGNKAYR
ncbi:hypothetical protein [Acinetobacter higginsii]|uniref:hypothetical protein n=1 Tax=Acinetobacter higginsii TaxID=70347 RepID=UPI0030BA1E5C